MPKSKGRRFVRKTKLYRLWLNMRNRCNNKRGQDYAYYGGRGIKVCDRWATYELFEEDIGEPPSPHHTLERIDNDKDYEPGNVRWATRQDQSRNRPGHNKLTEEVAAQIRKEYVRGVTRQVDLARKYNITQAHVSQILLKKAWG